MSQVTAVERRVMLSAFGAAALAALLHWATVPPVVTFAATAVALTAVAYLIGEATSQLGHHVNTAVAGIVQSALGNLPELLICIFALRAGLVAVVQAALVGSILTTAVLILGVALLAGSIRHGELRFESRSARMIAMLLTLAVSAIALPTLAHELHLPAANHAHELAVICSIALLIVFVLSMVVSIRGGERRVPPEARMRPGIWPIWMVVVVLATCAAATALLSDWFVEALEPAAVQVGISDAFASLVIVGLASNTLGVAEIRLALAGKADLAVSVALNGALQVALALVPLLVLISFFFFPSTPFTLTIAPFLAVALMLSVLIVTLVCMDGRADVVDGAALIGLYVVIAAIFWWG